MEDNYHIQNCDDSDVLSFGDDTCKISKFRKAVKDSFESEIGHALSSKLNYHGVKIESSILLLNGNHKEYSRWFNEGIDCEVLNLGSKNWKKGKVKIQLKVEFYVEEQELGKSLSDDEPENSLLEPALDDIRQIISGNS